MDQFAIRSKLHQASGAAVSTLLKDHGGLNPTAINPLESRGKCFGACREAIEIEGIEARVVALEQVSEKRMGSEIPTWRLFEPAEYLMRAIMRRLRKIEDVLAPPGGGGPMRVRYGHLKQLPADYTGERHTVITNLRAQTPNREWYDFEGRPGPEATRDRRWGNVFERLLRGGMPQSSYRYFR